MGSDQANKTAGTVSFLHMIAGPVRDGLVSSVIQEGLEVESLLIFEYLVWGAPGHFPGEAFWACPAGSREVWACTFLFNYSVIMRQADIFTECDQKNVLN